MCTSVDSAISALNSAHGPLPSRIISLLEPSKGTEEIGNALIFSMTPEFLEGLKKLSQTLRVDDTIDLYGPSFIAVYLKTVVSENSKLKGSRTPVSSVLKAEAFGEGCALLPTGSEVATDVSPCLPTEQKVDTNVSPCLPTEQKVATNVSPCLPAGRGPSDRLSTWLADNFTLRVASGGIEFLVREHGWNGVEHELRTKLDYPTLEAAVARAREMTDEDVRDLIEKYFVVKKAFMPKKNSAPRV